MRPGVDDVENDGRSSPTPRRFEDQFKQLLEPIADMAMNWDVDIEKKLVEFIQIVCDEQGISLLDSTDDEIGTAHRSGREQGFDFRRAALIVFGSAKVYGKKVDHVYDLLYHLVNFLSNHSDSPHASINKAAAGQPDDIIKTKRANMMHAKPQLHVSLDEFKDLTEQLLAKQADAATNTRIDNNNHDNIQSHVPLIPATLSPRTSSTPVVTNTMKIPTSKLRDMRSIDEWSDFTQDVFDNALFAKVEPGSDDREASTMVLNIPFALLAPAQTIQRKKQAETTKDKDINKKAGEPVVMNTEAIHFRLEHAVCHEETGAMLLDDVVLNENLEPLRRALPLVEQEENRGQHAVNEVGFPVGDIQEAAADAVATTAAVPLDVGIEFSEQDEDHDGFGEHPVNEEATMQTFCNMSIENRRSMRQPPSFSSDLKSRVLQSIVECQRKLRCMPDDWEKRLDPHDASAAPVQPCKKGHTIRRVRHDMVDRFSMPLAFCWKIIEHPDMPLYTDLCRLDNLLGLERSKSQGSPIPTFAELDEFRLAERTRRRLLNASKSRHLDSVTAELDIGDDDNDTVHQEHMEDYDDDEVFYQPFTQERNQIQPNVAAAANEAGQPISIPPTRSSLQSGTVDVMFSDPYFEELEVPSNEPQNSQDSSDVHSAIHSSVLQDEPMFPQMSTSPLWRSQMEKCLDIDRFIEQMALSYEEACRRYLQETAFRWELISMKEAHIQEMAEWSDSVERRIQQSVRTLYMSEKAQETKSKVLEALVEKTRTDQSQHVELGDIVQGESKHEVCLRFLGCLFLANDGNLSYVVDESDWVTPKVVLMDATQRTLEFRQDRENLPTEIHNNLQPGTKAKKARKYEPKRPFGLRPINNTEASGDKDGRRLSSIMF